MSRGFYQEIAIGTVDSILLSANNNRRTITISNPTANALFIAFGKAASLNASYAVPAGTRAQEFQYDDYGGLLCQDIHAIFATAAGTVAVLVGED